ncbi:MAG: endolytic transglycosylase MltG [bacterium]|nr:endolytic transglycosylase MltG [bacterium]
MTPIEQFIERAFTAYERALQKLSLRWREHANRRTIIALVVGGFIVTFLYLYVVRPPDNFPLGALVTIEEGASVKDVGIVLEKDGVVRSGIALRYLVVLMGHEKDVHAGDYLFKEPRDLFSIARAIIIGAYGLEPMRIRIPEGATTKEMALILGNQLLRFDSEKFLLQAQPMEGYLFPDTYYFLPNATEDLVLRTMRQNFDSRTSGIDAQIKAFGRPLNDVVTMASLLEREARTLGDRRMIAGVLWNRLKKGMLLQVDAAFLYTLGKGTYQLTTKDLTSDSPYNTYRNKGLPPGPIGSPSLNSLLAAVTPTKSNYLYYLADRSGVTHYSATYAEHLRKKNIYIY